MTKIKRLHTEGVRFLNALATSGYAVEEVDRVAAAWGVNQADVTTWKAMHGSGQLSRDEAAYRQAVTAAMSAHVLGNLATVTEPTIQAAKPDDLRAWKSHYDGELRRLHELMLELSRVQGAAGAPSHENPAWCRAFADFYRLAGYLWMVEHRLEER